MRPRRLPLWPFLAALLVVLAAPAPGQLDDSFMPKGGKTLLLQLLAGPAADGEGLSEILSARSSEDEWRRALASRIKSWTDREQHTLAAYLAVNLPVPDPEGTAAKAGDPAKLAVALPRDGREVAWNECQFCHSLFTSHLTQDRDVQAWLNLFESPFHREMKVTAGEREEFARYSTINMPMRIEDVPPDLRF